MLLCVVRLDVAVTVSSLSAPPMGSDPHHLSYLRLRLGFFGFCFPEWFLGLVNGGIGHVKSDSVCVDFSYFNELEDLQITQ